MLNLRRQLTAKNIPMSDMDELLNQLKAEYGQQATPKTKPVSESSPEKPAKANNESTPLDKLLADVKTEVESNKLDRATPKSQPDKKLSSQIDDRLITELKQEQKQQQLAAQKQRQQELAVEQTKQSQKEQRRKAALQQEAKEWLQKLNPKSDEGRWFEEFSYSYESKLAAAIDYLQALRDSGL
jgi:hypothetical protein